MCSALVLPELSTEVVDKLVNKLRCGRQTPRVVSLCARVLKK